MGRGDKKTKKGKITIGSFGKSRPAKVKKKK
jgi:30S ribosomal protein S31